MLRDQAGVSQSLARGHPSLRTHLGQRRRLKTVLVLSPVEDREAESEVSVNWALYMLSTLLEFSFCSRQVAWPLSSFIR